MTCVIGECAPTSLHTRNPSQALPAGTHCIAPVLLCRPNCRSTPRDGIRDRTIELRMGPNTQQCTGCPHVQLAGTSSSCARASRAECATEGWVHMLPLAHTKVPSRGSPHQAPHISGILQQAVCDPHAGRWTTKGRRCDSTQARMGAPGATRRQLGSTSMHTCRHPSCFKVGCELGCDYSHLSAARRVTLNQRAAAEPQLQCGHEQQVSTATACNYGQYEQLAAGALCT